MFENQEPPKDIEPMLRRPRITWAHEIEPEPVVWAWQEGNLGRIAAGTLAVAAGREGTGKSSWAIWLTAQITRGTLPGSYFGTPRPVFYVAVEDSWKHTLVPRLMAAGADLTKVARFDVVNWNDAEVMLSLPHDNELLESAVVEHQVALVVIDPLLSVIGEKINTHQSREVRSALDPLAKIADRTDSVLLGIAHFNKGTSTDASSLITGSGAFKDVPRSVFGFARDEADELGGRVMTQTKNSLGPEGPSLSYAIEEAVIKTKFGPSVTSRFVFTGESERSVADVLRDARSAGDRDDIDDREAVDSWLTDLLEQGRQTATDVYRAADSAGYSKDQAKRAKKRLNVTASHPDVKGPWYWDLPTKGAAREQGSRETEPRALGSLGAPLAPRRTPGTCRACGQPLAAAALVGGFNTCPSCDDWKATA